MLKYSVRIKNSDDKIIQVEDDLIFRNPISNGDIIEIFGVKYEVTKIIHECGIHGESTLYVQ